MLLSSSLVSYVLKAAIRDRLIIAMMCVIVLATSMSIFMASSALFEKDQFLAVYSSGSLRILGVLGLVLFSVFFIRRSFDAKDIEFLLSRPISRVQLILSYSFALSLLAVFIALACGVAVLIVSPQQLTAMVPILTWTFSLMVENIIMVNIALFFSMFFSSPAVATMAVLAFYALARMMGQFLGIIEAGTAGYVHQAVKIAMNMVSSLTPRLDLFGQTSWLIYGMEGSVGLGFVLIQCVVFVFLLLMAALLDLTLRQF